MVLADLRSGLKFFFTHDGDLAAVPDSRRPGGPNGSPAMKYRTS